MELRKNAVLTLTVTGYSAEGFGVARTEDGAVVFVKGALEGETCAVRLLKVGRSVSYGRLERVIAPSPARLEPDCPYFGRCGGCAFRHMTYEEELRAKGARVRDALLRIGGVSLPIEGVRGAVETSRYRNKAQFPVAPGPNGPRVGFFRARSHDVIPVEQCLLQHPAADAAANAVRRWMDRFRVPAYDERTGEGLIRYVYVRTNRAGEALVCLIAAGEALPQAAALTELLRDACPSMTGLVLGVNRSAGNVILGDRYHTLWGRGALTDRLCGMEIKLSVPTFFQINRAQTEVLYGIAAEYAGLTGRELLLDLYCGAGTIGLSMAGGAARVVGVERNGAAVADARESARRNGIQNAAFFCADAGEAAARLSAEGARPDVVLVDPPRKGLSPGLIGTVTAMAPSRVVYLSCDPATLARDLKLFSGYEPLRIAAVDLFPRTSHVECAVLLRRSSFA